MTKKILCATLAAAALGLAGQAAHAADGEIEFTGQLQALTCTINGGNNNFTVTLPSVTANALAEPGSLAGTVPFSIELTNCQNNTGVGAIMVYFERSPMINMATNQLLIDTGAGAATNVELRLMKTDHSKINVGLGQVDGNLVSANLVDGGAKLDYLVAYTSPLGGATAGEVRSRVMYTILYQ